MTRSTPGRTRYDPTRDELAAWLGSGGTAAPSYRVDQLWEGLYTQGGPPQRWTNLPTPLRAECAEAFPAALTEVRASTGASVR